MFLRVSKKIKARAFGLCLVELLLRNRSFEKLLLEAVDEGLSSLGDSSRQALYFHLEKTFKIKRQDIPHRIEDFADALGEIFGVGAKVLEIMIIKRLYEKVGGVVKYSQGNLVFTEYVAAIKQSFAAKKQEASQIQGCVVKPKKKR